MRMQPPKILARAILGAIALSGAMSSYAQVRFSSDFPSGSIGAISPLDHSGRAWQLALRNDNDNPNLRDSFRTWWYTRADRIDTTNSLRMEFTGVGFAFDFRPVYSYDNKHWEYFSDAEAALAPGCIPAKPDSCRMVVNKQFRAGTVWIARTFPYTVQDLKNFQASIQHSPYIKISSLGTSPLGKGPLTSMTITDPYTGSGFKPRKTIVVHARTHAAETGPSFVIEGLVATLMGEDPLAKRLRSRYVFKIVPMLNPDGVELGNYRTNGTSIDLEQGWEFDRTLTSPVRLLASAPYENKLVNETTFGPALTNQSEPVVLALNLHASVETPDTAAYFFPHFGDDPALYTKNQTALWQNQLSFIRSVARHYDGRIEQPPAQGGSGFLRTFFPETWWWHHAENKVNAITMETTYGKAGFDHWVTTDDLRGLGKALALAIDDMDRPGAFVRSAAPETLYRGPFKPEIYNRKEDQ